MGADVDSVWTVKVKGGTRAVLVIVEGEMKPEKLEALRLDIRNLATSYGLKLRSFKVDTARKTARKKALKK